MRFAHFSVLAFLLLMPWVTVLFPDSEWRAHDISRTVQIGLCAVCWLSLAVFRPVSLTALHTRRGQLVAATAVGLTAASVLLSEAPLWALREVLLMAGLFGITWVIASAQVALSVDLIAVVAAAAFSGVLELLLSMASTLSLVPLSVDSCCTGYDNRRFFNHVQTVALLLVAIVAVTSRQRSWQSALAWVASAGQWAVLLFSGGRATVLAVVVGICASVCLGTKRAAPWLRWLTISVLLGSTVYFLLYVVFPLAMGVHPPDALASRLQDSSSSSRFYLWKIAFLDILESPLLGIGPMHFAHVPNGKAAHPHNLALQIAAEWGMPMLVLVGWCAYKVLRQLAAIATSDSSDGRGAVACGLFVTVIAVLVDSFFSGNFVMPVSQVWIAALGGWTLRITSQCEVDFKRSADIHPRAYAAVSAALFCGQLWILEPVYLREEPVWPAAGDSVSGVATRREPRLWSKGSF